MKIVILGDSHVNIYKKLSLNKYFYFIKIHHTDSENCARTGKFIPYLMNTIGDSGNILLKSYIEYYKDQEIDYMMFIFGEPDVRIHFDKQISKLGRDEDEVIKTLCDKYIAMLKSFVPIATKIIIRYILPPTLTNNHIPAFTPRGTLEDRIRYTNKINDYFNKNTYDNVYFFDNYYKDILTKLNGELKAEYSDQTSHYSDLAITILNKEIDKFIFDKKII